MHLSKLNNRGLYLSQKRIEKWDTIYKEQEKRWNGLPSKLAETTLKFIFHNDNIKCITDIGGGYGRDSIYFLNYSYQISIIESSKYALELLRKDLKDIIRENRISIIKADALELTNYSNIIPNCNLIFCNYFLHILTLDELNDFFLKISKQYRSKTLFAFNLISKKDFHYNGKNIEEIEKDIYWSFWDKKDILNYLSRFSLKVLFWEEEVEIEYVNQRLDKVYSHFIISEIF